MKTRNSVLLAILLGMVYWAPMAVAQNPDAVLMTVEDEEVTIEDFENIYRKNNQDATVSREELDEYLELFINFKLKVYEAKERGLDTNKAFQKELSGYRQQLARPYLTDTEKLDELMEEAYERMKTEVKASHILVKVDLNAAPKDTVAAYNKIMALRERILRGEDFAKVAKASSEDKSAEQNMGNLGYFSAFQMVFPFENAAYNTPVGEVSEPVRTRYGYHIVYVEDKRQAKGEVKVAHIMLKNDDEKGSDERAKSKIDEIYQLLQEGAEFEELALKYSEDQASARKGGELPWFGTGKMVEEFETVAFELENQGDVSEPFKTDYGWHIVKKIDEKPVPPYEEIKGTLKTKVSRDSRTEITEKSFIRKLKEEYDFEMDKKQLNPIYAAADSTLFKGKLDVNEKKLKKTLFSFDGQTYSALDFAQWVRKNPPRDKKMSTKEALDKKLDEYVDQTLMDYEDSKLEEKHAKFRLLMNEYRDGILLFELMDQRVWSRAVKDTTGLEEFFASNRDNYMWPKRVKGKIYTVANEDVAKELRKLLKKGVEEEEIYKQLNEKSQLNVRIESGTWAEEDQAILKEVKWEEGLSDNIKKDNQIYIVEINEVMEPARKTLDEARGIVTADYQNYLEEEWIKELREKYDVKVNKEVLYSIL